MLFDCSEDKLSFVFMTFEFEFHTRSSARIKLIRRDKSSGHTQFGCLRRTQTLDRILMC
jgi:hypothetical protein